MKSYVLIVSHLQVKQSQGCTGFIPELTVNLLGYPQFVDFIWSLKPDTDAIKEVPKSERMIGRPELKDLFTERGDKQHRDAMIMTAFFRCGYSQKEIADVLDLHYSTVSKILSNSRFKT